MPAEYMHDKQNNTLLHEAANFGQLDLCKFISFLKLMIMAEHHFTQQLKMVIQKYENSSNSISSSHDSYMMTLVQTDCIRKIIRFAS